MSLRPPVIVSPSGGLGNSYPVDGFEASGQSFKSGAILVQTSGKLQGAGADPDNLVGLAQQPAEGVADTRIKYHRFNSTTVLEITIDDTSAGEAAGTYVAAIADINSKFGLAQDTSSGIYYVDQDETSAVAVILLGFRDPIGTTQPRAIVQLLRERLIEAA